MDKAQVTKDHYNFRDYMIKRRWISIWTQLDCLNELHPNSVLEIGPGMGLLKNVGLMYGINIETLDIAADVRPDHIGSITDLPFEDNSYDVICAFQVLEHLDFDFAMNSLSELNRVASKYVLISLPNAQTVWRYRIYLPKLGERDFMFARPFWKPVEHTFDGEHHWEINKKGYEIDLILSELGKIFTIRKAWRVWENPYHHFFLLEKA